jgi:hypothetical protein
MLGMEMKRWGDIWIWKETRSREWRTDDINIVAPARLGLKTLVKLS